MSLSSCCCCGVGINDQVRWPSGFSSPYIWEAKPICLQLLRHWTFCALTFAFARAGSNNAAKMAMIAITTSNSIKVKAFDRVQQIFIFCLYARKNESVTDFVLNC